MRFCEDKKKGMNPYRKKYSREEPDFAPQSEIEAPQNQNLRYVFFSD